MEVYHVKHAGGQWKVYLNDNKRASANFLTRVAAYAWARRNHAVVYLYAKNGKLMYTYNPDPDDDEKEL